MIVLDSSPDFSSFFLLSPQPRKGLLYLLPAPPGNYSSPVSYCRNNVIHSDVITAFKDIIEPAGCCFSMITEL